jgi:hypothetical protein
VIQRLRPTENRLRDDHRLRKAESLIGLGVVAYEALQTVPLADSDCRGVSGDSC